MGSQDGLVHLPMVYANPGDIILVPDPGYTAYETGIQMAGAISYYMPLKKENDFLPELEVIPEEIADQAKMMILNFPGIPFQQWLMKISLKVIAFAKSIILSLSMILLMPNFILMVISQLASSLYLVLKKLA